MKNFLKAAALALAAASTVAPAIATEFSVTPVRIFMTPRDRAVAITVTNDGDQEMVVQADLYSWKQGPGGEDQLVLTEEMILSPPIVRLPPKSRQVVRLARLGPPPTSDEQTFRMIVREVPEAAAAQSKELKLQVALAFSLPIFITPPNAKRQLVCATQRVAADTVRASCENKGNAYAQPRGFALLGGGGEKVAARDSGGYLLPEIKRSFDIKRAEGNIPGGAMKLQVTMDDGSVQLFDAILPD